MGWASDYITCLKQGKTVIFRPKGRSMEPIIKSGQLVTVEPVDCGTLKIGDVVLCEVKSSQYLHQIKDINQHGFLIGNNRGFNNGWVTDHYVYGRLVKVET